MSRETRTGSVLASFTPPASPSQHLLCPSVLLLILTFLFHRPVQQNPCCNGNKAIGYEHGANRPPPAVAKILLRRRKFWSGGGAMESTLMGWTTPLLGENKQKLWPGCEGNGFIAHQPSPDPKKGEAPQCLCSIDLPQVLMLYTKWVVSAQGSPHVTMFSSICASIGPPLSFICTPRARALGPYKSRHRITFKFFNGLFGNFFSVFPGCTYNITKLKWKIPVFSHYRLF